LDYFDKYQKQFVKSQQREELPSGAFTSLPLDFSFDSAFKQLFDKLPNSISDWKFNPNSVNELISKTYEFLQKGSVLKEAVVKPLKLKKTEYYNVLINLGLVEKYVYEEIINGKSAPYKEIDPVSALARISKLDIYIKEIIFDYNILFNYKNLVNLPLETKVIIDSMSAEEIKSITKLKPLSEISRFNIDYFETIKLIRQQYYDNHVVVSQFLLEYLCQLLLNLLSYLEKTFSKKIAQEFLIYLINKTLTMEKVSAKLKESKSAAIEATQKTDLIDVVPDHDQSREFDNLVKGNIDQFSYEGSDISSIDLDAGGYNSNM